MTRPDRLDFLWALCAMLVPLLVLAPATLQAATPDAQRFAWGESPFIPVTVTVKENSVVLDAGGEQVELAGQLFRVDAKGDVTAEWKQEVRNFHIVSLLLKARQAAVVETVHWFAGTWGGVDETAVQRTSLQDNVLFLRRGKVSFFLSLDFPYSKISGTSVSYPAAKALAAGETYAAHSLTVGACQLSGIRAGQFDRAEIEAVSAYVEERFPPRFERPMLVSACITNRLTYARDGLIFYSMRDNPTLGLNPKLLEEDIRICGELGIEYFQVFEGVFDWLDEAKTGEALLRLTKLAKPLGVRLGDYAGLDGPYCGHYNYEKRSLDKPEWRLKSAGGKPGPFCLGSGYGEFLREKLVAHNRKYGEGMICLDFLQIHPCHATGHGHAPGDVYQQVLGLVSLCQALGDIHPDYLVWSNSGNWSEFMPKLTWVNPNVYLTDPVIRAYAPTLNALKILGDSRREQMVSMHNQYFVPFRAFCNCEYYAFPRSRVHDLRVFEYSFLQGLAVTPNICPAEVRTFFNRIPGPQRDECARFMRRWMDFIRKNFDLWKHTAIVGDAPGIGATEIYAHTKAGRGFVCLVNQNPFPRTACFRLDQTIGLTTGHKFYISEIYPKETPLAEQSLPWSSRGQEIVCTLPPHGVRFLQVEPAREPSPALQVLGLPAQVKKTSSGYDVLVSAPQGKLETIGLIFPPGEAIATVSARQKPTVKCYTFPATSRILEQSGNVARVEVQFPRGLAPRALENWKVTPGDVAVKLPAGGCHFLGGLVHGAFSEDYEVELTITTRPVTVAGSLPALAPLAQPPQDGRFAFPAAGSPLPEPPKSVHVELAGAKELQLEVTDAGDGFGCDMANWADARLTRNPSGPIPPGGAEVEHLGDNPALISSTSQSWGELGLNTAAHAPGKAGEPLRIAGKSYAKGLGHHASGAITIPLEGGYRSFDAEVGLHPPGTGSVVFRALVDGGCRFDSGVIKARSGPKKQTFTTSFELPFIEPPGFGCMPGYDDDTVLELAFDDPNTVQTIAARINSQPVEVRTYPYSRQAAYRSYYLELTGNVQPGTIELALDIEWK